MNSEEFSEFIGHNYAAPYLQTQAAANRFMEPELQSLNTETREWINDDANRFLPAAQATSPEEVSSNSSVHPQVSVIPTFTPATALTPSINAGATLNFVHLKDTIVVEDGVLTVKSSSVAVNPKKVTWSDMVISGTQGVQQTVPPNATISYNEDGSSNVKPSSAFLLEANK